MNKRLRRVLVGLLIIAICYPILELSIVFGAFYSVALTLGGDEFFKSHAPARSVLLTTARPACDVECYGRLQTDRYREVEVEITGEQIINSTGLAFAYFISEPGLYGFRIEKTSSDACAPYMHWVAAVNNTHMDPSQLGNDLLPTMWLSRDNLCLVAERHQEIRSQVAISTEVLHHHSWLGEWREYRRSIWDITRADEQGTLVAEGRSFQLRPSLPIARLVAVDGTGVMRYEQPPLSYAVAVPPGGS